MTHRDDSMTRRVTGVHQAFAAGGRQAAPVLSGSHLTVIGALTLWPSADFTVIVVGDVCHRRCTCI